MKTYEEIKNNKRIFSISNLGGLNTAYVKLTDSGTCSVVWSNKENRWEHVSVSPKVQYKIPTWNDMCQLKDIFFNDDEEVLQLHPAKNNYVNIKDNCLHLWKPIGIDIMGTLEHAAMQTHEEGANE